VTDLEALYRAVLARPEEDTPRLAYADEVEERGDQERAEFVRLACACEKYYPDTSCAHITVSMSVRMVELHDANRERWEPACVTCGGEKKAAQTAYGPGYRGPRARCPTCNATGRQPCRWERGFPVVQVAEMRQAWEPVQFVDGLRWKPTPWLCDAIRTHHVAGVDVPVLGESRDVHDGDVPPCVWNRINVRERFQPQFARAIVLAALEWLDAQGAG
jgi:uncharacterized protein (TIGR02996 family)